MNLRRNAIVIGGSMAGLLAARVLSDHFENVTIIERDNLPKDAEQRRGVPHGRHAHALLAGGQKVLEELFPGICDALVAHGAVPADPLLDGTWFFEGAPLRQAPSGTRGVLTSRPFLENAVRRRVRNLDGIDVADNETVRSLATSENGKRITGVRTDHGVIEADLVVDASGRGSHSPRWLESLGFAAPREDKVEVDLVYTTHLFKRRPDHLGGDKFSVIAPTPEGKRGGVIGQQEDERWIVTLFGCFGHTAPSDLKGFVEFAKGLPAPFIYNVIRDAEPLSGACSFRFPASSRRRYEHINRFPDGFLVFGDAICSFNPIYGQGMSVAALQAATLRDELANGLADLGHRFFKQAAKVIDNPWNIAVGADLKMPEARGNRTIPGRMLNRCIARLHKCAHHDAEAARAFIRVAQLIESPATLLRPSVIWRILKHRNRPEMDQSEPRAAAAGLRIQKPARE